MGRALRIPCKVRDDIHTVVLGRGGHRNPRERDRGGEDVERRDRGVIGRACGQWPGQLTTNGTRTPPSYIWPLAPRNGSFFAATCTGPPLSDKKKTSVRLGLPALRERADHGPDRVVQQADLPQAFSAPGRFDCRETPLALGHWLVRTVRRS